MPSIDYASVRASVGLAQVLALVGFSACARRGSQWRGPCPIHGSSSSQSRSFSAHLEKHAYRCFTCGSSGNQLDLWAAVTKLDLYRATLLLCERLSLEVPTLRHNAPARRRLIPNREEEPVIVCRSEPGPPEVRNAVAFPSIPSSPMMRKTLNA
jgi:hypothetical protein